MHDFYCHNEENSESLYTDYWNKINLDLYTRDDEDVDPGGDNAGKIDFVVAPDKYCIN